MDLKKTALGLLPEELRTACESSELTVYEEIRLRLGKPVKLLRAGKEYDTHSTSVTSEHLNRILEKATGASLHSVSDRLKNGFITYRGIRIGLGGNAVTRNGEIYAFSRYTSLNLRIPHPFCGSLKTQADTVCAEGSGVLIVSPPGGGKTTALRELIRLVSDKGNRVSVVDDREELFPYVEEGEVYERGECTDVVSGADKERAALMLLRTMNPEYIALDEISKKQEINAVREICGCGVKIISTAHGTNIDEMQKRQAYRELFEEKIFTHILEIHSADGKRDYFLKRIC